MFKRSENIIFISIGLHSEKSRIIEMEMGPWYAHTHTIPRNIAQADLTRSASIWSDPIRFNSIHLLVQTTDAKAANKYCSSNNESNFPMSSQFQLYNGTSDRKNNNNDEKNWLYFSNSHPVYRHLFEFKYTFHQAASRSSLLALLKLTNGIDNNDERTWAESHFSRPHICCNSIRVAATWQKRVQIYTAHIFNMQIEIYAYTLPTNTHSVKAQNRWQFYWMLDWKVIAVDFNNLNWTDFSNRHTHTHTLTQAHAHRLFTSNYWNFLCYIPYLKNEIMNFNRFYAIHFERFDFNLKFLNKLYAINARLYIDAAIWISLM